jgi:hypothetical protein
VSAASGHGVAPPSSCCRIASCSATGHHCLPPVLLDVVFFLPCDYIAGAGCDRTTSKMRGLSPKIILGDSRRSENAQTHTSKHTIPNMKFKLKLLQIKCRVLGFTKVKAPKCASKDNQSFCGNVCLSR